MDMGMRAVFIFRFENIFCIQPLQAFPTVAHIHTYMYVVYGFFSAHKKKSNKNGILCKQNGKCFSAICGIFIDYIGQLRFPHIWFALCVYIKNIYI